MGCGYGITGWLRTCSRTPVIVTGLLLLLLLVAVPAPLLPIARGFSVLCARYPAVAQLTNHLASLPLGLLLTLAALSLGRGVGAGTTRCIGTLRFNRAVRREAAPVPPRLSSVAATLDAGTCVTYLEQSQPAAFCYGFLRPRIAVTAGLLARLDDDALRAVLAHERQHVRRRDPARYLAIHALSAAAFMFPLAPALQRRVEARIELAADRAALAVAPRGALAAALLAVLAGPSLPALGAAGLTATEARIAHLIGDPALPVLPLRSVVVSAGLAAVIALATIDLATSATVVTMTRAFCAAML